MCQARGGVWIHTYFSWRLDEDRDDQGKPSQILFECIWIANSHYLLLQGSRDGDRIRQLVEQGKLVPLELTVQVLINALIASPSQVSNENFKYYNRSLNPLILLIASQQSNPDCLIFSIPNLELPH